MLKKIINKFKITAWLIKIGDGFLNKINLLKWLYVPSKNKDITIKFKVFGQSSLLILPNNRDQLLTLRGVFLNEDWRVEEKITPKTVFDLGSYTGISVMYFLLKYPKTKVYAFEPDAESYKYLTKNYSNNTRVVCNNTAISDKNGEIPLYTPNKRNLSSSIMPRDGLFGTMVRSKTFDDICVGFEKIDLLKFNIEGGEANIFGTKSFIEKVGMFIGEVHEDLIPEPLSLEKFKKELSKHFDIEVKKITKMGRAIWFGKSKNFFQKNK